MRRIGTCRSRSTATTTCDITSGWSRARRRWRVSDNMTTERHVILDAIVARVLAIGTEEDRPRAVVADVRAERPVHRDRPVGLEARAHVGCAGAAERPVEAQRTPEVVNWFARQGDDII